MDNNSTPDYQFQDMLSHAMTPDYTWRNFLDASGQLENEYHLRTLARATPFKDRATEHVDNLMDKIDEINTMRL